MSFPLGSPYSGSTPSPAYSGTFIPEIWSGKMIEKFYSATVLAAISNTDYEGEIKNQGDKVNIRTKPTITIRDYQADQTLVVERPAAANVTLLIDQGKYFNTVLDDVMKLQSDIDQLSLWAEDASEQMKITIDTYCLNRLYESISSSNKGATAGAISSNINLGATTAPVSLDSTNVLDLLVDLGQALDEKNIPETGRWVIIPAWVASRIKKSDLKDAAITGDNVSVLRNGRLGMIDRFTLYSSNLLPTGTSMRITTGGTLGAAGEWVVLAGHAHGYTFASQMTEMETLRAESTFGTLMRGLQVFGHKVIDGTALAGAIVTPA